MAPYGMVEESVCQPVVLRRGGAALTAFWPAAVAKYHVICNRYTRMAVDLGHSSALCSGRSALGFSFQMVPTRRLA